MKLISGPEPGPKLKMGQKVDPYTIVFSLYYLGIYRKVSHPSRKKIRIWLAC